jgi:hypothetical protein
MDCAEERNMRARSAGFWSKLSTYFSLHKKAIQRVFIVTLNACVLGYLVAAVILYNAQGKPVVTQQHKYGLFICIVNSLFSIRFGMDK